MEWIAGNLALILCTLAGFGLLVTEAFMPGFGVAGVSGIILEVVAVYLTWTAHGLTAALLFLLGVLLVIGVTVFLSYRSAMRGRLSKSDLILKDTQETVASRASSLRSWIGKEAVVATPLRPSGFVESEGKRLSAASGGDFIEKGTPVQIVGAEGDHLVVQPKVSA
mgnify:FL=1